MKIFARIIDLLIACLIIYMFASLLGVKFPDTHIDHNDGFGYSVIPDPDSAFYENLSDTLPHNIYKHLLDSARNADEAIRHGNDTWGSSWNLGSLVLATSTDCDTCSPREYASLREERTVERWYIGIKSFDFNPKLMAKPAFFRKNGKNYLKHFDTTSLDGTCTLVPFIKEVSFRYSGWDKNVLFQLNKGTFVITAILFGVFALALLVTFLLALNNIFKLCVSIAGGMFFTEENKQRLTVTAYAISICTLLPAVAYWAMRLYHYRIIKAWFVPAPGESGGNIGWLLVAVFFWLLSKAFNKGLQLQQEHDLTV